MLHDDNGGWKAWLAAQQVTGIDCERGPLLTDSSMVVEAALQGQGVGLVRLSLAIDELEKGRLMVPFSRIALMPTGLSYYLVRRGGAQRPEVSAFCGWVEQEICGPARVRLVKCTHPSCCVGVCVRMTTRASVGDDVASPRLRIRAPRRVL